MNTINMVAMVAGHNMLAISMKKSEWSKLQLTQLAIREKNNLNARSTETMLILNKLEQLFIKMTLIQKNSWKL